MLHVFSEHFVLYGVMFRQWRNNVSILLLNLIIFVESKKQYKQFTSIILSSSCITCLVISSVTYDITNFPSLRLTQQGDVYHFRNSCTNKALLVSITAKKGQRKTFYLTKLSVTKFMLHQ